MAVDEPKPLEFPKLPAKHPDFVQYVTSHPTTPMLELLEPYKKYDAELRKAFAQHPDHPTVKQPTVTAVFDGHEQEIKIRARDITAESDKEKESYIMPLKKEDRKTDASPAIVQSLQQFKTQFSLFSESALADMDWSNVVAAGSSVVTSLLPVPEKYNGSKRAMREFYHEIFAPASDVDLFLYALSEEQAIEKIRQIEKSVKDALLVETTTVRTKNAITIASQYPTRHIQIVLRVYKSISEIVTGFDVDCSCAAFDGSQVWASPRALAAYMTQINTIDLTRRSPSYESRLSKYNHRGFEVYWPELDRSRVCPTIYERSFARTEGLARLLILEQLPKSSDRDAYLDQRRTERGRPAANRSRMRQRFLSGNIKNNYEDEVAEWVDADEVSDYHTFNIPYGPKFHAKKIEKLLFTKDLLLNAEWNKPKDREVHLHRHPAFFGTVDDIIHDCCGYCPKPTTVEEDEVAEQESKIYVSGDIVFIKDDPGRQAIGSFNPLSADDYTEMAYIGNTEMLCQAIIDGDLDYVESWLSQEDNDPNTRDHTGRGPLHLAVAQSTPEVVQALIDHGARLVARLVDGRTALHLAAMRGNIQMIEALLQKSAANEEEANEKLDARRRARMTIQEDSGAGATDKSIDSEDSDIDMIDNSDDSSHLDATTESSMVNIKSLSLESTDKALEDDDEDEPDVYDINVLAWDSAVSPLHLAIVKGHVDVVKYLVDEFGADVLLPVKLFHEYDREPRGTLLTLVLALQLPFEQADTMARTLFSLGATSAQADFQHQTAFHVCAVHRPEMLDTFTDADATGVKRAVNHLAVAGNEWSPSIYSVLTSAIEARDSITALRLLTIGSKPHITFEAFMKAFQTKFEPHGDSDQNKKKHQQNWRQPVIIAAENELPDVVLALVDEYNVDVNTLTRSGYDVLNNQWSRNYNTGSSLLDVVKQKIADLHGWEPSVQKDDPPKPLKDDAEYLDGLQQDTYQYFTAQRQIKTARGNYETDWNSHVEHKKAERDRKGVEVKQAAIFKLLERYRKLESVLSKRGAKTFKELYPDIEAPQNRNNANWGYTPYKLPPFEGVQFEFRLPDLGDATKARYVDLFNAVWRGDSHAVKQLTLVPWRDADGQQQPPLKIAVFDFNGLSPFAIAVLHGNLDLARTIMKITQAQYVPPDQVTNERKRIRGQDDEENYDSEDEDSDSDVQLETEVVKDNFTIDNVGEVSVQVQCTVTPLQILQASINILEHFLKTGAGSRRSLISSNKRTNTGTIKALNDMVEASHGPGNLPIPNTLVTWAIYHQDLDTLDFLLDTGRDYGKARKDAEDDPDNTGPTFYKLSEHELTCAYRADSPAILSKLVQRIGAGVPLTQFVKKSGLEVTEKPKYYQGLSVYGKKRQDWADAGRNVTHEQQDAESRPPLLQAAYAGALKNVEWLLSDAPLRCYKEFAKTHEDDKRLQKLSQNPGGFEASVERFIAARSHLAIHCCIMAEPTAASLELLKYLLKTFPNARDAKSKEGLTPLLIAFELYREDAAKVLIDAGADQTARDKSGYNILHHLLYLKTRLLTHRGQVAALRRMLDLVDKRLLTSLFTERSASWRSSQTPLALWIASNPADTKEEDVLRLLLEFSEGVDLNVVDGQGQTPTHALLRIKSLKLVRIILEHKPSLINREDSTGRTPYEIVEDAVLSANLNQPPHMPSSYNYRRYSGAAFNQNTQNVVDRPSEDFVKDFEEHEKTIVTMWKLLQKTKMQLEAEGKSKRILVTLNEANEVAKRLAATKSHRAQEEESARVDQQGEGDDEAVDEVATWLPNSAANLQYIEDPDRE